MDLARYQTLAFRREGKILHMTLNRPEQLNGVNEEMHDELSRVFTDITNDAATGVVVITGAGRAFSAGGDIASMKAGFEHPENFATSALQAKQILFSLLDCPKPILAKVNGHAIGLGATIALFCDMIFVASHAKLGDPHVKVGLTAGDGGAIIWPQLIGYARAKQYLMLGDLITATDAERIGLINQAVPAEQLDELVDGYARRLANGASKAIEYTKTAVNIGLKQIAHSVMDASIGFEFLTNYTKDHLEAVNAHLEKRTPVFTGK